MVSRPTATKYIELLAENGFLEKEKIGRSNFYINTPLYQLFKGEPVKDPIAPPIKTTTVEKK